MTQTLTIESFAGQDPAVLMWQEALAETVKIVPEAVDAVAQKLGGLLLNDRAA